MVTTKFLSKKKRIRSYKIKKNKDKLEFENILKINKNPFLLKLLNYKKKDGAETIIKFNGYKDKKNKLNIKSAKIVEEKNKIEINGVSFDENFKIEEFENINLDYIDKDNKKNSLKV